LRDNPISSAYQILCYNCNCAKRDFGVCPHNKKEYEERVIIPRINRKGGKWYQNIKLRVTEKMGGRCECCGEDNPYFLTVEHENGDGREERKKLGGTKGVLKKIDKLDNTIGYKLLCYNCNCALGHHGYCHGGQNE